MSERLNRILKKKQTNSSNSKELSHVLITTPLYYPSSQPHIGHVFSTLLADLFNRYYKQRGHLTYFVTGTDEHGRKIYDAALKANQSPKEYVDQISNKFKSLWKKLNFEYDVFWRTTSKEHEARVQQIFRLMKDKIYFGKWSGYYCTQCEENCNESQIIVKDTKKFCRFQHELKIVEENSYFFRMSDEKEWVKEFLEKSDNFIYPLHRRNELINTFLTTNLPDLSITREHVSWGISVPDKPEQTIYVWIDALLSYITSLGFPNLDDDLLKKFWLSENVQVIQIMSKEIIRFHGIYWPILLKTLHLPIPIRLIAHGWIVDDKNVKMSKSLHNFIDPNEWINFVPVDGIRYYLAKEISLTEDSKCSSSMLLEVYHADLVNKLGNLLLRVNTMIHKFCEGIIPRKCDLSALLKHPIYAKTINTINQFDHDFLNNEISRAIKSVVRLAESANGLIDHAKPWLLYSGEKMEELNECLVLLANVIRVIFSLLNPILVNSAPQAHQMMNFDSEITNHSNLGDIEMILGIKINEGKILYPRIKK